MRTSELIIIEGLDNTGKSTLINRLCNVFDKVDYTYTVIHLTKPPKGSSEDYMDNYYMDLMKQLEEIKKSKKYDFIILDRGWISEFVYGQLYRFKDAKNITEMNIALDLISKGIFDNIHLFMLTADPKFCIRHEDGQSLSNKDTTLIKKELKLFKEAFDNSLIDNKHEYKVDVDDTLFLDVLPFVVKAIFN